MRILIVEDGAFNAFCLSRLLGIIFPTAEILVAKDSILAQRFLAEKNISLVILDGHLGAAGGLYCNGPALVDELWLKNSTLPVITWTDSESMRRDFAEIFKRHNKVFNDNTCWPKVVSQERILQSFTYLLADSTKQAVVKSAGSARQELRYG